MRTQAYPLPASSKAHAKIQGKTRARSRGSSRAVRTAGGDASGGDAAGGGAAVGGASGGDAAVGGVLTSAGVATVGKAAGNIGDVRSGGVPIAAANACAVCGLACIVIAKPLSTASQNALSYSLAPHSSSGKQSSRTRRASALGGALPVARK
ncbi:hypothetical protein C4E15_04355 [Achromobacter spanius]|uniref:Uncharacterized protein n=1 Tax=Achromobacter spanius TaxID=217203 RepID=A0A2S5GW21_9BURK|nr:hypothetical protein C4E15_04355 [Achromobacter spanius]